jgi:hypothetical protein
MKLGIRWSAEKDQAQWWPWRLGLELTALMLLALPWLVCGWLGELIASTRWSAENYALSLTVITLATMLGWRAFWRVIVRWTDVTVADYFLVNIEPAEPWTLFPQTEQLIRAEHLTHCQRRWRVSPRSSGWEHLRQRAWKRDAIMAIICVPVVLHPWWVFAG